MESFEYIKSNTWKEEYEEWGQKPEPRKNYVSKDGTFWSYKELYLSGDITIDIYMKQESKMIETRKEISEYYSKLVNEIDIKCEETILIYETKEIQDNFNKDRQQIITKIQDVQKIHLNNLKQSNLNGPFCFFIPKSEDTDSKFEFKKRIGQLVVTKFTLSDKIIENKQSDNESESDTNDFFTFKESAKSKVISQLINLKRDNLIIDLTQTETVTMLNAKSQDEIISEKVYFEKYLQVTEFVREFILSNESIYFEDYFRNTTGRMSNFRIDYESSDDEDDSEDYDYYA
ncbi:unnamed protein product [Brachionus calyciflorus]|uniref:Uncharacterized protein n=1 Tax=Brachionus calyciflorus TaxID=104777 RepID=A0A814AP07_9BILA|nr:unnamed protein product [Brachionus calyciflorus]